MYDSKYDFIDKSNPDGDRPIILLGGSGFIGLQTAQALFYYYNIYNSYFDSLAPSFYPEFVWSRLNFLEFDTIEKNLTRYIKKSKAKFIINFAGISLPFEAKQNPKLSKKINVTVNEVIINICNKLEVFPIFISSDHVYSGNNGPYEENTIPEPLSGSVYGNQKFETEKLYFETSNDCAILRSSTTLGINLHFQKQNVYTRVLSAVKNNKEIKGAVNKMRTPTHVLNISFFLNKLIEKILDNDIKTDIYHLPGEYMSEFDLFRKIAFSHEADENLIKPYEISNDDTYPLNLGLKSKMTSKIINARYLSFNEGISLLKREFTDGFNN